LIYCNSGDSSEKKLDFLAHRGKHSFTYFLGRIPISEDPRLARHNREGQGADQRGFEYAVNYQPDWLRQVKVTRQLETGRQSTKTLFRNPVGVHDATA